MATSHEVYSLTCEHQVRVKVIKTKPQDPTEAEYNSIKFNQWKTKSQDKVDGLCCDVIEKAIALFTCVDDMRSSVTAYVSACNDLQLGCEVNDGRKLVQTIFCLENLKLQKMHSLVGNSLTIVLYGDLAARYKTCTGPGLPVRLAQIGYSASVSTLKPGPRRLQGHIPDSPWSDDLDSLLGWTDNRQDSSSAVVFHDASDGEFDYGFTIGPSTGSGATTTQADMGMSGILSALEPSMAGNSDKLPA